MVSEIGFYLKKNKGFAFGFLHALVFMTLISQAAADRFSNWWYDGNAEISVYDISEKRYGEFREGRRIMVFVTEPLRLSTGIKPDSRLPQEEKVDVLKLNDVRKFTTGIYEYSVMTSVFSTVEAKPGLPPGSTYKISFTGHEWCGNVFERYLLQENEFRGVGFSYFESEGEQPFALPAGGNTDAEENLWIRIRELQGEELEYGGEMAIRIIPSVWSRRKAHSPPRVEEGLLKKGHPKKEKTALGIVDAVAFTWTYGGNTTKVSIEKAWPRRILSWKEPDGSWGKILASKREPYWEMNGLRHGKTREALDLPLLY